MPEIRKRIAEEKTPPPRETLISQQLADIVATNLGIEAHALEQNAAQRLLETGRQLLAWLKDSDAGKKALAYCVQAKRVTFRGGRNGGAPRKCVCGCKRAEHIDLGPRGFGRCVTPKCSCKQYQASTKGKA